MELLAYEEPSRSCVKAQKVIASVAANTSEFALKVISPQPALSNDSYYLVPL